MGVVSPWAIGLAVKLQLQARGVATLSWAYFLGPQALPEELWAAMWFALPFVGLALLGRAALRGHLRLLRNTTPGERRLVIGAGLLAGLAGVAHVLVPEFRHFNDHTLALAPIGAAMYVPHILAGLSLGVLAARSRARARTRRSPAHVA